jgi:hypothetical protein
LTPLGKNDVAIDLEIGARILVSLQIEMVVNANINSREFLQNSHTKRLPTDVGRISDVLFLLLKHDVFRDGPVGG